MQGITSVVTYSWFERQTRKPCISTAMFQNLYLNLILWNEDGSILLLAFAECAETPSKVALRSGILEFSHSLWEFQLQFAVTVGCFHKSTLHKCSEPNLSVSGIIIRGRNKLPSYSPIFIHQWPDSVSKFRTLSSTGFGNRQWVENIFSNFQLNLFDGKQTFDFKMTRNAIKN